MNLQQAVLSQTRNSRIRCPVCSGDRKKSHLRTMGITVEDNRVVYQCFHCNTSGAIRKDRFMYQVKELSNQNIKPIDPPTSVKPEIVEKFLLSRGIDPQSVQDYPIVGGTKWFGDIQSEVEAIGFLYGDSRHPQAIKWRCIEGKSFTQQGSARSFFGLNQLPQDSTELVICEGEMDVLALASIGFPVLGCPNGAPQKISDRKVDPEDDGKYSFVWDARELIEKAEKIIFCGDQDTAGEALIEELARRIGRAKCWKVTLPEKDANETLQKHGADALREAVLAAQPLPLEGVYSPSEFEAQILSLYDDGVVKGASTGLSTLDPLYTVLPGQLSVFTGLPGSGKSELIDQICVNIALQKGWRFAIASFENPPAMHIAKLAEKVIGKPFFGQDRMNEEERDYALQFLNDHFVFLQSHDGAPSTVQSIIDRTKAAVMRMGVRGLIIDPYNYLDMGTDSEHQAISKMLTDIVLFCKSHDLHAWFVAHPAKALPDSGVPKGQHISGSAAWFAKADMGVTVHRNKNQTEVHVWKSRFKWVGSVGMVDLNYHIPTGTYSDKQHWNNSSDWDVDL